MYRRSEARSAPGVRLFLPRVLFALGICFIVAGIAQPLLPKVNSHLHIPATVPAGTMIKDIPLLAKSENLQTTINPLVDDNFTLDSASMTFVTQADPEQVLRQYDNWFPSAGWRTWGNNLGDTFPRWIEKGTTRATGLELRYQGDWPPHEMPYFWERTEFVSDYRLAVAATRRLCWFAGDGNGTRNTDGITTVTITLYRLK